MPAKYDAHRVSRRTILYFAGFDPRGAAAYHAMTTEQFQKHCMLNGRESSVSKRVRVNNIRHQWDLTTGGADRITNSFNYLMWDDLVRVHWTRSNWLALLQGAWAGIMLAVMGTWFRMLKVSRPVALSVFGPFILVTASLLTVLAVGLALLSFVLGWHVVGGLLSCLAAVAAIFLTVKIPDFNAPWMARIVRFVVLASRSPILEKWENRPALTQCIVDAVSDEETEEVLIISHSVGTPMAVLALADAISENSAMMEEAVSQNRLTLITLGQVIPGMSWTAKPIEEALRCVSSSDIPWLDVSSPADPACYAQVDPCQERFGGAQRAHLQTSRFYRTFSDETYRRAQLDRFEMHFLYLMAPDAACEADRKSGFDLYSYFVSPGPVSSSLPATPSPVTPFFSSKWAK